jgi:ParB-like chromosome segregation protein Spo0J
MARVKGQAEVERQAEKLEALTVEYVPVGDLKANDWNPNRQDDKEFKLLKASMKTDGFTQPIVVLPDLTIVDGEHRWRAADDLGYKEIPVVKIPMSPEQARVGTLRHNRARGSEDVRLATEVLRDLEKLGALDWAQKELGLGDLELQELMSDLPAAEALAAEEFSQAWEPTPRDSTTDTGTVQAEDSMMGGIAVRKASTPAAVQATREREDRIAAAPPEQREEIKREKLDVFRLQLVFHDDEADLVRETLGGQPAAKLVEILQAS